MKFELHHHTLFSLNDGVGDGKEARSFCEANDIKALAITDHGHCMAHDAFRAEFSDSSTKLIYGVEAYVPSVVNHGDSTLDITDSDEEEDARIAHLLLLAKDYEGLKCIYRMVTAGYDNMRKNKPVISQETLNAYCAPGAPGHGHVIALSACMQGVLSIEALYNEFLERQAQKLLRKADRIDVDMDRYDELTAQVGELSEGLIALKDRRQSLSVIKAKKYTTRKKAVEKLRGTPSYEIELEALNKEIAETEQAAIDYPTVKASETALSKDLTALKAEAKKLEGKATRYQAILDEADNIRGQKTDDTTLYENTLTAAQYYLNLFGEGCFYIELQYHGIPEEAICFPVLADVAEELSIPVVATNDSHVLENSSTNMRARQILRSLRFNRWEENMTGDSELYVKSDEEVRNALSQILPACVVDAAIANTETVAEQCDVTFPEEEHYPKFQSPDERNSLQVLKDLCNERFRKMHFKNKQQKQMYRDRARYEVDVIEKLGVVDYLLIVQDFLAYGRLLGKIDLNDPRFLADPYNIDLLKKLGKGNVGMSIGIGRGSAVGSLVCYLLGITGADPIKYNLLFERKRMRYLNPANSVTA